MPMTGKIHRLTVLTRDGYSFLLPSITPTRRKQTPGNRHGRRLNAIFSDCGSTVGTMVSDCPVLGRSLVVDHPLDRPLRQRACGVARRLRFENLPQS